MNTVYVHIYTLIHIQNISMDRSSQWYLTAEDFSSLWVYKSLYMQFINCKSTVEVDLFYSCSQIGSRWFYRRQMRDLCPNCLEVDILACVIVPCPKSVKYLGILIFPLTWFILTEVSQKRIAGAATLLDLMGGTTFSEGWVPNGYNGLLWASSLSARLSLPKTECAINA